MPGASITIFTNLTVAEVQAYGSLATEYGWNESEDLRQCHQVLVKCALETGKSVALLTVADGRVVFDTPAGTFLCFRGSRT